MADTNLSEIGELHTALSERVLGLSLPENIDMQRDVRFDMANPHQPTRFAIIPENNFLSGVMTIHQVPEEYQHINGPVGEVEILMVGESMAPIAPPNGVRFPVIGADEVIGDSGAKLCPDAGKVKWEVE